MATVVLCTHNVANSPEETGHLWAHMQYVFGLRQCGCEVYWMECFRRHDERGDRDSRGLHQPFLYVFVHPNG